MEMSATTHIRRPAHVVWEFVMDPTHDALWRTGVDESGLITEPPVERGTVGFVLAGRAEARWQVTEIEPGASVDWNLIEGPMTGTGGYRVESVDDGTRFTLLANVAPKGLFRVLGPLFGRLGRRRNQADVDKLRTLLERPDTA